MQEDNHRDIQRAVMDLLLALQAFFLPHLFDEDAQAAALQLQLARSLYAQIDPIAVSLARPSLFTRESREEDKTVIKAYLIFLTNLRQAVKHLTMTKNQLEITLQFAELIGLWNICSVDSEIQSSARQVLSTAASLIPVPTASSGNLLAIALAINQEQGPCVGGATAQLNRLMKVLRSISVYTPALGAAWADLYERWQRCAAIFGLVGLDVEADKSILGVDTQSTNLPHEVSLLNL